MTYVRITHLVFLGFLYAFMFKSIENNATFAVVVVVATTTTKSNATSRNTIPVPVEQNLFPALN